tara:strand:+ start:208 stop:672 length:465 start_codon:yes stop_codon:yes gene_type:complete
MARVGVNRIEFLLENLRRELDMVQTTLKGLNTDVVTLTGAGATRALTADDSGAIVNMGGSNASTVTLPTAAQGLKFRFVATTAHAHVINGGASSIQGGYHHNTNAATVARVAISNKSSLTLHNSNAAQGDTLECWCDGEDWHFSGIVNDVITQA